jgi:DNA polymerase-3 subunit epsilon
MTAAWLPGDLCSFDLETTGVDTANDRIVTATVIRLGVAGVGQERNWLVNPGIEIPAAATAVHGVTTDRARAEGTAPETAVPEIVCELLAAWACGLPVVIMSARFDLSMLQHEFRRCGHEPFAIGPVLDPLAIDRMCDPSRFGKRTLDALAAHYAVKQTDAHNSRGDALTAARVVWKQARLFKETFALSLEEMQQRQAAAHRVWAEDFEAYLRRKGKQETIGREWPFAPLKGAA